MMTAASSDRTRAFVATLCAVVVLTGVCRADDSCAPRWHNAIGQPGADAFVSAIVSYDDNSGAGAQLYVGGGFTTIGGAFVNGIARLDESGCEPQWIPLQGFSGIGITGEGIFCDVPWGAYVMALAVFDGALYVGGHFKFAGGVVANGIARWDGQAWSSLGMGLNAGVGGVAPIVNALAVYDDGDGPALHVGGLFETAGGVTVNGVAKWDGSSWSALSDANMTGVEGWAMPPCDEYIFEVYSLEVFDDGSGAGEQLYVGGLFSFYDADTDSLGSGLVRWNGTKWSTVPHPDPDGPNGAEFGVIRSMTVMDGALYFAGSIDEFGPLAVNQSPVRWDGTTWTALTGPLAAGFNDSFCGSGQQWCGAIYALTVFDGDLHAGGRFFSAGGVFANRVARWNGDAWTALANADGVQGIGGLHSEVFALAQFGDALYVGGSFPFAAGVPAANIAKWVCDAPQACAEWDRTMGQPGVSDFGEVWTSIIFNDELYIGGAFTKSGDTVVNRIARWDGSSWQPVGSGFDDGAVVALAVYENQLIAAGTFISANGQTVNRIARWTGSTWDLLAPGVGGANSNVGALTVYDGELIAAGVFTAIGGTTAEKIARWDGTSWKTLGTSLGLGGGNVWAFAEFQGKLIVGGFIPTAGGVVTNSVAVWDGRTWSALTGPHGTGINCCDTGYHVRALAVFDDGSGEALYVAGYFPEAGGVTVDNIAKWNGSEWSSVAPGLSGSDGWALSLSVFDDGTGEALYVGGWFSEIGGQTVPNLARLTECGWEGVGGGDPLWPELIEEMTIFEDRLVVMGTFTSIGGEPAGRIASWGPCAEEPPQSPLADLNGDGIVDGADLGVLLSAWGTCADPDACPADLNGDGVVDGADLGILLAAWTM